MNLGEATIVLRSRKSMEVIDLSLRFLRQVAPLPYLRLAVLVLLPAWLACVLVREAWELHWGLIWLLAVPLSWLCELPFLCLAGRLLFERQTSAKQALRDTFDSFWSGLFSRLLVWCLLALGALLIIGPVLAAASYCFSLEALVLEKAGAFESLGRARKFLRGRSSVGVETVLLRALVTVAFVGLCEFLTQTVLIEGFDLHPDVSSLFEDGGSYSALLGLFLAVPYTTTFRFLAYINERTRQDGWDVQVALLDVAGDRDA